MCSDYDKAAAKVSEEIRKERGVTPEEWAKENRFDAEKARKLLAEAGFPVQKNGDAYSCPDFPTDKVSITYNTDESNRSFAEFIQAQWKQNLGITIPLENDGIQGVFAALQIACNMKALLYFSGRVIIWTRTRFSVCNTARTTRAAQGFMIQNMTKCLTTPTPNSIPQKRFEKLAQAEFYLMEQLPMLPLTINATNWMKKPYIKGMYPNPGTLLPWKFVYIERDTAKWDKDVENIMKDSDPLVEKQLQELMSTQKAAAK